MDQRAVNIRMIIWSFSSFFCFTSAFFSNYMCISCKLTLTVQLPATVAHAPSQACLAAFDGQFPLPIIAAGAQPVGSVVKMGTQ